MLHNEVQHCAMRAGLLGSKPTERAMQEPILALRRQLAMLVNADADAGECWLQHAQVRTATSLHPQSPPSRHILRHARKGLHRMLPTADLDNELV